MKEKDKKENRLGNFQMRQPFVGTVIWHHESLGLELQATCPSNSVSIYFGCKSSSPYQAGIKPSAPNLSKCSKLAFGCGAKINGFLLSGSKYTFKTH